jgi:hypothetical protein
VDPKKEHLLNVFGHLFALWAWAWDRSSAWEARTDEVGNEFTANLVALLLADAAETHDLYEVVFAAGCHGATFLDDYLHLGAVPSQEEGPF